MIKELLANPFTNKVYLSGPITGIKDDNKDSFSHYEYIFKNFGFQVVNPHRLFTFSEVLLINNCTALDEKQKWAMFMKRDISALMKCDFVAVLPYWEKSEGVNLELSIADKLKMPIINAVTYKEINYQFEINRNSFLPK